MEQYQKQNSKAWLQDFLNIGNASTKRQIQQELSELQKIVENNDSLITLFNKTCGPVPKLKDLYENQLYPDLILPILKLLKLLVNSLVNIRLDQLNLVNLKEKVQNQKKPIVPCTPKQYTFRNHQQNSNSNSISIETPIQRDKSQHDKCSQKRGSENSQKRIEIHPRQKQQSQKQLFLEFLPERKSHMRHTSQQLQ